MSDEFEDGREVFIREIEFTAKNQASYDPSQWTLSQHDNRPSSFPLSRRKERDQHGRNLSNSPQSESDTSLSHENDFANLEALLEDQQKVRANCTKHAAIAEKDNRPNGSKAKSPNADPEDITALTYAKSLRHTIDDEVVINNLTAVHDAMEYPSKRQSTVCLQAEIGISEPSRTTANSIRSSLVDPASRRLQSSYSTAMIPSLLDSSSLNHSSILEKSRKMAAQSQKHRTTHAMQERRSNFTLSSITGSRPTHWDQRDLAVSNKRRSRQVETIISKKSRAAVLSTFTQHNVGETRLPSSRKQLTMPARKQAPNFTSPGLIHCHDPIVDDSEHEKPKESTRNSFAPSFLSLPSSFAPSPDNAITSPGVQSPQLQSSFGGRGKKSKAMFSGRLCKRLQSMRDTIKGDKIRFQSGQYPFSIVSLDMNDPRNRATSMLDVTLLETASMSNRESQRIAMLGFVHHASGGLSHLISQYAWLCFACDTARELLIVNGSQLRIYNAVSLKLTTPLSGSCSSSMPTVKWVILATTLCEPYPNLLPKLPDVPATPSL